MILRIIQLLLIIELLIIGTQAQLYIQNDVYAKEPDTTVLSGIVTNWKQNHSLNYNLSDKPSFISIPRIGIKSSIDEGYIKKDGIWKVYMDKLSYAEGLGSINNSLSNIVVYGHATDDLLGNLHNIKKGDKIKIFGYYNVYEYKVVSKEQILPDEPDKLLSVGETNLSIFTCDGEEDETRLLVKAKLVKTKELPWKEVSKVEIN